MSKRFGRNQKRKLREAVKTLKAQADLKDRTLEYQRKEQSKKETLFDMLVTAIEQIAPYSICLNPKTINSDQNYGFYSLAIYPPIQIMSFDDTMANFEEPLLFSEQKVYEFCVDVEDYRDQFSKLVHVYTKDRECDLHYMISKEALYTVGLPAKEIMRQFTNKWRQDNITQEKKRAYTRGIK